MSITVQLYSFASCSTCKKAIKWLRENNINCEIIDIIDNPPSKDILISAIKQLGDRKYLFNTSGKAYREIGSKVIKAMTDEEAIQYLSNLRQIGRWSAEMILLFTFNRSNIWPLQDIGLLRAISKNYKKKYFPPKAFLNKLYKKFTPYCSVATWYLWRSIDDEPIQY